MPLQPSWKASLGIAKEAVAGTPVAPTAFIPINAFSPKRVITMLEDKSWRGSAAEDYALVHGKWHTELGIPGDVYPDTFPWFLASILGAVATSVVGSGVNDHLITLLNSGTMQPTTKTLTDFYVANARAYANAVCVELSVKWTADGKLTYDSKWVGKAETTASTPTVSFSTEQFMAAWQATMSILGTTPKLIDGEINMKRSYDVVDVSDNSQDPVAIFLGPLTVDGKATVIMEDDTYYNNFVGNNQGVLTFDFTRGAAATLRRIKATLSLAAFTEGPIDRGSSYVKLPLGFKGLANATDAGASGGLAPIKWNANNTAVAGTYN